MLMSPVVLSQQYTEYREQGRRKPETRTSASTNAVDLNELWWGPAA